MNVPDWVWLVVVGSIGVLAVVVLLKTLWRVAEANEALIISGLGASRDSAGGLGFKIVVGKGAVVLPAFQTVRRLNLDLRSNTMTVRCVSRQGIPVEVRGVVAYKIGDDAASIANAARRFLDEQGDTMQSTIHELFSGHLRATIGGVTIEDMLHERDTLTAAVRDTLSTDLQVLGLTVDSLQLQEIDDTVGYIANLGKPQAAAVESQARIAAATADQTATEREQEAAAEKASYVKETQIKQAGFTAEVEAKQAEAAQAGPLAEAIAKQKVVEAETRTASLQAELAEKALESSVRKPADAKAYAAVVEAQAVRDSRIAGAEAARREAELKAEADAIRVGKEAEAAAAALTRSSSAAAQATKVTAEADAEATLARGKAAAAATEATGRAEGAAIEAKGRAEGAAIEARARALATESEAVIAQQLAEQFPATVKAVADAFAGIDNMVVLNGSKGVMEALTEVIAAAGSSFGVAKQAFGVISAASSGDDAGNKGGNKAVDNVDKAGGKVGGKAALAS